MRSDSVRASPKRFQIETGRFDDKSCRQRNLARVSSIVQKIGWQIFVRQPDRPQERIIERLHGTKRRKARLFGARSSLLCSICFVDLLPSNRTIETYGFDQLNSFLS